MLTLLYYIAPAAKFYVGAFFSLFSKTYSFTCHVVFLNFTLVKGVQTFKRGSEPAEVVQALYTDTIWVTKNTLKRLDLLADLRTPRVPQDKVEDVVGKRDVWASLFRMLSAQPGLGEAEENGSNEWICNICMKFEINP